jgi:hypothetical protein
MECVWLNFKKDLIENLEENRFWKYNGDIDNTVMYRQRTKGCTAQKTNLYSKQLNQDWLVNFPY